MTLTSLAIRGIACLLLAAIASYILYFLTIWFLALCQVIVFLIESWGVWGGS